MPCLWELFKTFQKLISVPYPFLMQRIILNEAVSKVGTASFGSNTCVDFLLFTSFLVLIQR
jgi:hypothetical protein